MNYIAANGRFISSENLHVDPGDHSYRYGDGLFETIKIVDGVVQFAEKHFERLFFGMELLKFKIPEFFTKERIEEHVLELYKKNKCGSLARVRLSVSRGDGGLYDCDNKLSWLIECWPIEENSQQINENGLVVGIFPDAMKSCDKFSNLKSANYLPYVMAAIWAKENKLNDALILNQYGHVCDATIANVFWSKGDTIFTPPLNEGCIAGVLRRHILDTASQFSAAGYTINESVLSAETLLEADEVFLTNVISGIRWVRQCGSKNYKNEITMKINSLIS